jgi:subtilase family serine protease
MVPDPTTLFAVPTVANLVDPFRGDGGGGTTNPPSSFTPAQVRTAYGFDQIPFIVANSGSTYIAYNAYAGKGETIAIVDAYNDPNIFSDLAAFNTAYSLPQMVSGSSTTSPTFNVYYVGGGGNDHLVSTPPANNSGWATEISLDVEWAHAMAPQANIQLFEAAGADDSSLLNAIDWARYSGAQVVSMSFGGGEWSGETSWDAQRFTSYPNKNVTFVASSGDRGSSGGAHWPAVSPNVVGVGGTTLNVTNNTSSETTAWSGSGGGISDLESEPAYQNSVQSSGSREVPDVAYDANPSTGVAVYDTYQTRSAWAVYGGTSVGAPQWSALFAIADQGRVALTPTQPPLDGATQTLSALYLLTSPSPNYNDITQGSNGAYSAAIGYDMVTGLGTPRANNLVPALVSVMGSTTSGGVTFSAVTGGASTGSGAPAVGTNPMITSVTTTLPGLPTPADASTQTQPVAVIVIVPPSASAVGAGAIVLSNSPTNQSPLSTASSSAIGHTATGGLSSSVTVLSAAPASFIRPPQPLDSRSAFNFDAWLRLHDEDKPFESPGLSPLDSAGLFIAHRETAIRLDLLAIARTAEMLGRIADASPVLAPLGEPSAREATASDSEAIPPMDPVLTGLMVSVAGAGTMALHNKDRSDRRRRRSPGLRVS